MAENKKIRVAVVHNKYRNEGGEDTAMDSDIKLLRHYGHEVLEIYQSNYQSSRNSLWKSIGYLLKSSWNKTEARKVLSKVHSFKPDVVHIHNFWFTLSPAVHHFLAKAGYPVIQTLHNFRLLCVNSFLLRNGRPCEICIKNGLVNGVRYKCYNNSSFQSLLVKRMVDIGRRRRVWDRDIACFISGTEFQKNKFIQGGIAGEKIVVRNNVVFPQEPCLPRSNNNLKKAIYLGRVSPEKGMSILLKASDGIHGTIVICGTGPSLRQVLQTNSRSIHVKGHVPRDEICSLLRESSFMVLPSLWYEIYPMSIIEAFSQGVPCIAPDFGGIAEIIKNGKTGLLFNPGDPVDLREKMNKLFDDRKYCEQLGKNAHEEFLVKYSPELNYRQLITIYNDASSRKKR